MNTTSIVANATKNSKEELKASFIKNYKTYLFIANTKSSRRDILYKEKKGKFFAENVKKQVEKIEKFHLSTLILLLGVVTTVILGILNIESGSVVLNDTLSQSDLIKISVDIIVWMFIFYFIFNPLVYFAYLPRPIDHFIKKISAVDSDEQQKLIKKIEENDRTKKILSRYSFSGMATYDEDGNRTDKIGRL